MGIEEWKPINGYEGLYDVSNYGQIYSRRKNIILKGRKLPSGYLRVKLPSKTGKRDFYIHRLVADAFCEHHDGCDVVNHIDNNTSNNNADNLEWTTQLQNVHYGMSQKRYRLNATPVIGYKDGKQFKFASAHQAGEATGCDHSGIIKCCKGKYKETNGFKWVYAKDVI